MRVHLQADFSNSKYYTATPSTDARGRQEEPRGWRADYKLNSDFRLPHTAVLFKGQLYSHQQVSLPLDFESEHFYLDHSGPSLHDLWPGSLQKPLILTYSHSSQRDSLKMKKKKTNVISFNETTFK